MTYDSTKSLYNSKRWEQVREYVLSRDHYLCCLCGESGNTVHHIIWLTEVNINDVKISLNPDNLVTVCHDCHNKVHNNSETKESLIDFDEFGNIIKRQKQPKVIDEHKLKLLQEQKYKHCIDINELLHINYT